MGLSTSILSIENVHLSSYESTFEGGIKAMN